MCDVRRNPYTGVSVLKSLYQSFDNNRKSYKKNVKNKKEGYGISIGVLVRFGESTS